MKNIMGFGTAIKTCYKKYFVLKGRASRAEFWWFALYTVLVAPILFVIVGVIFGSQFGGQNAVLPIILVWFFGLQVPLFAAAVRRLQDVGMSGWWMLLFAWFPPLVFAFAAFESENGPNKWGQNVVPIRKYKPYNTDLLY